MGHPEGKLAVAMSGGVDSSVAAALLGDAGWDVVGFTMRLGTGGESGWEATNACCGLSELHDARRVADRLGIPHYVLNQTAAFERLVIADFVDEYRRGRTPNPCIRCNQHLKFASFVEHARAFGCQAVATGHYARLRQSPGGRWELWRGIDPGKDQSYVLHTLTQEQMAAARFPLGELTKPAVRALAASFGLPTADKPDSQEICFVAAGRHAEFVAERAPSAAEPGDIVGLDGQVLGRHRGLAYYTVGQRRGLGLPGGEPQFVVELRADRNEVVVAPEAEAGRTQFRIAPLGFVSRPPADEPFEALVQVRYRMTPVPCRLSPRGDFGHVELTSPLQGLAPGQAAVFYDGSGRVLAGGTIAEVQPA